MPFMLRLFFSRPWLFLFLSVNQVFVPCLARPESKGIVSYVLEGQSLRRTYTYIFSGIVHCGNQVCSNARVQVQVEPDNSAGISGETRSASDGRFEVQIACDGSVDDSVAWRIIAEAPVPGGGDPVELEGRVIMTEDETTVIVQRPVQINHG